MATDYKKQYRPDQLEPFFPHEINKMIVVVLCTLAVIMFFVILPELLGLIGIQGMHHHEQPADPHTTPPGIKPEWYFLGTYEYLRLMPTTFLGISGKTWGVLSQGLIVNIMIFLPFWYRKNANKPPAWPFRIACTAVIAMFLVLTLWGGWPEEIVDGEERLAPFSVYFQHSPMMILLMPVALIVFYILILHERRGIRAVLDAPPPESLPEKTDAPPADPKEAQP